MKCLENNEEVSLGDLRLGNDNLGTSKFNPQKKVFLKKELHET